MLGDRFVIVEFRKPSIRKSVLGATCCRIREHRPCRSPKNGILLPRLYRQPQKLASASIDSNVISESRNGNSRVHFRCTPELNRLRLLTDCSRNTEPYRAVRVCTGRSTIGCRRPGRRIPQHDTAGIRQPAEPGPVAISSRVVRQRKLPKSVREFQDRA